MRKLIFKGKSKNGVWYTGSLDNTDLNNPIIKYKDIIGFKEIAVDPKTVRQGLDFTGWNNEANQKQVEVFEGDVVNYTITGWEHAGGNENGIGYFEWDSEDLMFYLMDIKTRTGMYTSQATFSCTVIGNVIDNPEFLLI